MRDAARIDDYSSENADGSKRSSTVSACSAPAFYSVSSGGQLRLCSDRRRDLLERFAFRFVKQRKNYDAVDNHYRTEESEGAEQWQLRAEESSENHRRDDAADSLPSRCETRLRNVDGEKLRRRPKSFIEKSTIITGEYWLLRYRTTSNFVQ